MSTDRPVACNFNNNNNNNTSTTTMTRTEDEPKAKRIHYNNHYQNNGDNNHDIAASTTRDQFDGIPTHSTDNTNNTAEDGIVTTQRGQERSGNTPQPQPQPSTTTTNNTAPTHTKHPIQTTCPTKANYTPHKKHGVIFEAIDGLTIEQYLRAIADHIGGINIKYASRLSGGRICVYLATEAHVQEICAPGGININDTFIPCRPYIMASKRVVLSNVLPDIPNETLMPLLHTFGKPTSLISSLSISTMHADLKHIKSFRRLVYMIIPNMEKIPHTINVQHDEVSYVIYVTCDDITCTNCHKPGHVAQNCHTTTQTRSGPITFADLAAGRRRATQPPAQSAITTPPDASTKKLAPSMDNTSIFPVLTPPRQRLRQTEGTNTVTNMQPKDDVTSNSKPQTQQLPKHIDDLKQHTEHHQAPEEMDVATPEPCTLHPIPQTSEMKKTNRVHKQQQQHLKNTNEPPEATEGKDFTDPESLLSDDSEDLQEPPRHTTPTTPKDRTTIADHKAIDTLCDIIKEQGNHPISINTFSHFLKACRRQKEPKIIAKEYTTNTTGLVSMLEENMYSTKDYNLRRRMKRIVDSLKHQQ
jgi:hypothetical protein